MRRAAVLALLLAIATLGGVGAGTAMDQPMVTNADVVSNSSQWVGILSLTEPRGGDFVSPTFSTGASVTIQHDAVSAKLDRYALSERVENTSSAEERDELLLTSVRNSRSRAGELREQEHALWQDYANGTIAAETLVRGLARLDAKAGHLRLNLDHIRSYATSSGDSNIHRRVNTVDTEMTGLQGPVRGQALAHVRGSAEPAQIYVEASPSGIVLSMLVEDRYVREAYVAEHRSGVLEQWNLDRVAVRMEEIYPTASEQSITQSLRGLPGGVSRVTYELPDGTLTAYLDTGTEEVFYEVHDRRYERLAGRETAESIENNTRLVVNRSFPGGPLRIATYHNQTGEPVETTVLVSDVRLETDENGVTWTLTPRTTQFTVKAMGPEGNVSVFVRPISLPALGDPG